MSKESRRRRRVLTTGMQIIIKQLNALTVWVVALYNGPFRVAPPTMIELLWSQSMHSDLDIKNLRSLVQFS